MHARLPLSVIITTIQPWPDLHRILEALEPQVAAFGGEVIIASSDAEAPEERVVVDVPGGRWLRRRDSTIPRLRAMAVEVARGEIIATTEDDCEVAEDWCTEILRGFARYPLARAITGVVEEHRATSTGDVRESTVGRWSSRSPRTSAGDPGQLNANIAYPRMVFPPATVPTGYIERDLNPRLLREGSVVVHDAMRVRRIREPGLPGRAWRLPTGLPGSSRTP